MSSVLELDIEKFHGCWEKFISVGWHVHFKNILQPSFFVNFILMHLYASLQFIQISSPLISLLISRSCFASSSSCFLSSSLFSSLSSSFLPLLNNESMLPMWTGTWRHTLEHDLPIRVHTPLKNPDSLPEQLLPVSSSLFRGRFSVSGWHIPTYL